MQTYGRRRGYQKGLGFRPINRLNRANSLLRKLPSLEDDESQTVVSWTRPESVVKDSVYEESVLDNSVEYDDNDDFNVANGVSDDASTESDDGQVSAHPQDRNASQTQASKVEPAISKTPVRASKSLSGLSEIDDAGGSDSAALYTNIDDIYADLPPSTQPSAKRKIDHDSPLDKKGRKSRKVNNDNGKQPPGRKSSRRTKTVRFESIMSSSPVVMSSEIQQSSPSQAPITPITPVGDIPSTPDKVIDQYIPSTTPGFSPLKLHLDAGDQGGVARRLFQEQTDTAEETENEESSHVEDIQSGSEVEEHEKSGPSHWHDVVADSQWFGEVLGDELEEEQTHPVHDIQDSPDSQKETQPSIDADSVTEMSAPSSVATSLRRRDTEETVDETPSGFNTLDVHTIDESTQDTGEVLTAINIPESPEPQVLGDSQDHHDQLLDSQEHVEHSNGHLEEDIHEIHSDVSDSLDESSVQVKSSMDEFHDAHASPPASELSDGGSDSQHSQMVAPRRRRRYSDVSSAPRPITESQIQLPGLFMESAAPDDDEDIVIPVRRLFDEEDEWVSDSQEEGDDIPVGPGQRRRLPQAASTRSSEADTQYYIGHSMTETLLEPLPVPDSLTQDE